MNSTNSFIIKFFNSLWNVQSMSESVEQAVDFDLHEPYYSQKIWKIKHDQRPKGRKFKNMCQIYEVNFCIHEGKNYTFFVWMRMKVLWVPGLYNITTCDVNLVACWISFFWRGYNQNSQFLVARYTKILYSRILSTLRNFRIYQFLRSNVLCWKLL